MPLRALLLRLGDHGSNSDSPPCRVLSALLQHLAPQPAFPTALCSALASDLLGAQFASSLLRDRLQVEPQLQLITSLSILEAAPDNGLSSTGKRGACLDKQCFAHDRMTMPLITCHCAAVR